MRYWREEDGVLIICSVPRGHDTRGGWQPPQVMLTEDGTWVAVTNVAEHRHTQVPSHHTGSVARESLDTLSIKQWQAYQITRFHASMHIIRLIALTFTWGGLAYRDDASSMLSSFRSAEEWWRSPPIFLIHCIAS